MPLPTQKSKKEANYLKKLYLMYGEPKAGKTTTVANFGSDSNKIIFFATEPGHKFQEIYKWKTDKDEEPTTWNDFKQCVKELAKGGHDFSCLAIDTTDNLWEWCSREVNAKNEVEHESDLNFGKGYKLIKDEFGRVINYLTSKGIGVIFISHAKTSDKELGKRKITYTDSSLPNTAKKYIHGLCDYIFYFYLDNDGRRQIRTKGTDTINSGDRSGVLPELMDMNVKVLVEELSK